MNLLQTISTIGWPRQKIHPAAAAIYADVAKNDSNHVAFTSRLKMRPEPTRSMFAELEVLEWFKNLHAQQQLAGEMVSGATEGTLTALYAFREHASAAYSKPPTVVISPLTHYSVKKSCRILGIPYVVAEINNSFGYDINSLSETLDGIHERGSTSAIVVSTLGYTQTGTRDPISAVAHLCRTKSIAGLNCFHHIDAAIGGLTYPFLGDPCLNNVDGIDSITTDFHKFGWCPYGTGILLLRADCREKISEAVPYVRDVKDFAILSSRSSLPAMAARAVIGSVSHTEWTMALEDQVSKRDHLAKCIQNLASIKLITAPPSLPFLCFTVSGNCGLEQYIAKTFSLDGFHLPNIENTAFRLYISDRLNEKHIDQIIVLFKNAVENFR
jgi:aromatic-L-amino-acid decarboxylase